METPLHVETVDDGEESDEDPSFATGTMEQQPLCSVLNTVVNHVMVPPSPLEPEEFQEVLQQQLRRRRKTEQHEKKDTAPAKDPSAASPNAPSILVPVLRIFGPIIRGDAPSGKDPVQSACLYIHGAYPYILARPIIAGPDGSLHHSSHLRRSRGSDQSPSLLTGTGHLDWDSPEAVESAAAFIQQNLEDATQASLVDRRDQNADDDKRHAVAKPITRCIRKVSVVSGRGFYTYCPGPPAPFLKVSFYDPSMRWRVKRSLERGLDLPMMYHPDPQQYDSVAIAPAVDSSQLGMEPLAFHCYEAHIPYTMQFFKDWNLAGMSYIHLSEGKFRHPLPASVRQRGSKEAGDGEVLDNLSQYAFLRTNSPTDCVWDDLDKLLVAHPDVLESQVSSTQSSAENAIDALLEQSSALPAISKSSSRTVNEKPKTLLTRSGRGPNDETLTQQMEVNPYWRTKETSCDLEIDVDVDCILNVNDVMTCLPDDEDEKQSIHWRAVPSLREIWQEERRRMAKLLPPEDDFLSQAASKVALEGDKTPPFTLSVKTGASVPGAQLAVKGMKRLLNVTDGLEEDFMRAAGEIVHRHAAGVTRVDDLLKPSPGNRCTPNGTKEKQTFLPELTPTVDDAIDALGSLASQFNGYIGEPGPPTEGFVAESDRELHMSSRARRSNTLLSGESCNSDGEDGSPEPLSQREKFENLSQTFYNMGKTTSQNPSIGAHEFSQRVDRGDAVVDGPFRNVEDVIDPRTLAPFESPDEEDDFDEEGLDEKGVEQMMSALATQLWEFNETPSKDDGSAEPAITPFEKPSLEAAIMLPMSDDESMSVASRADMEDVDTKLLRQTHLQANVTAGPVPPSRGDLQRPEQLLLPVEASRRKAAPPWLLHASTYASTGKTHRNDFSPRVPSNGLLIQPTRPPPRRDAVVSWHRKKCKRGGNDLTYKERKKTPKQAQKGEDVETNLNIDETTGKLMAMHSSADSDTRGVEEVDWALSQHQLLFPSQSQQSQQQPTRNKAQGNNSLTMTPLQTATLGSGSQSGVNCSSTDSRQNYASDVRSPTLSDALVGMANQGGRLIVEGGVCLKATTRPLQPSYPKSQPLPLQVLKRNVSKRYIPTPLTVMSVEIHVQCRKGGTSSNERIFALTPDPTRDKVFAVVYVYAVDPGGGETIKIKEHGCLYVALNKSSDDSFDEAKFIKSCMPREILGKATDDVPLSIESVRDERTLLMRTASIIRRSDPDMLLSWDPQSKGIGYLVERGENLDLDNDAIANGIRREKVDMVRLLGRTPTCKRQGTQGSSSPFVGNPTVGPGEHDVGDKVDSSRFEGSGLGSDWDDRVGAGAAAASIVGRLVFAGWKVISEEVKHQQNSYLPSMVSTILGKRIPYHDELNLTNWYACQDGIDRWRVLHHKLAQATATLLLFDALDVIGRAGEAARLSGVEFSQSFPGIRGSQYKVEGVLLRALQSLSSEERGSKRGDQKSKISQSLAARIGTAFSSSLSDESKSQSQSPWKKRRQSLSRNPTSDSDDNRDLSSRGYFFFSPSLSDTEKQEALEVQALNLEPQSGHHEDPLVVCDFTALYPSLMIAYNLCYSTACGRLKYHTTRREMCLEGQTSGRIGPFRYPESRTATVLKHHLKSVDSSNNQHSGVNIKDRAYIAPTGTIFVGESVVRGVLPQVLDELLSTRAMLKKASKQYKRLVPDLSKNILRNLEAKQLALKYVANVTYGYTSATFSGRCAMPLLADTIVECGRRTLTNAINLANTWGRDQAGKWYGCEVLYGDTDSVFIKLPGRSVQEAFQFGEEFCQTVTSLNPPPVQLKLEKVYLGSILQTKKKYCGMKFESKDQKKPVFEAKGIETIRRDQCGVTQKVLRNSLITLFRYGVGVVREYLCRQWSLILSGQLPVSDFILTGKVRSKYRGGRAGPVQASLFRRLSEADPGRVMRSGERLAYVIVATPGVAFRLRECVLEPMDLLTRWDSFTIHTTYYIMKHVNAALNRCLKLPPHNIDVNGWYAACPKPRRRIHFWPVTRSGTMAMISSFFGSDMCSLCGKKCKAQGSARAVVCDSCRGDDLATSLKVVRKLQTFQREAHILAQTCSQCNLCYEDASTFAAVKHIESKKEKGKMRPDGISIPMAACTCIDCPVTYDRHRLREGGLEVEAICQALNLGDD